VNGGNGRPPRIEDLPIEQRIEYIKASWDTSNPNCRFQVRLSPCLDSLLLAPEVYSTLIRVRFISLAAS
jgi:hypothetical protein